MVTPRPVELLSLYATIFLIVSSSTLRGALVAYEGFNSYSANSELAGQSGGTGWQSGWSAIAGVQVVSASLSYTGGSLSISGGDRALGINESNDELLTRGFSAIGSGGEVYFSFLFQEVNGLGDAFLDIHVTDDADRDNSGSIGDLATGTSGKQFGTRIRKTTDSTSLSGVMFHPGETHLLVGRFSTNGVSGAAGEFDLMELWVDPTSVVPGAPTTSLDAASGLTGNSIAALGMRTANIFTSNQYLIDEIKVGTDFMSVVSPVPEPSSPVFIGSGILALCVNQFRRKRSDQAG